MKPKKSGFKAGVIITTALGKTMQVLITHAFQGVSSSSSREAVNIIKKISSHSYNRWGKIFSERAFDYFMKNDPVFSWENYETFILLWKYVHTRNRTASS